MLSVILTPLFGFLQIFEGEEKRRTEETNKQNKEGRNEGKKGEKIDGK